MKKRLLTSIVAAVVLTSTIAPASNISGITDLRSQKVSAATDAQTEFLNKAAKQAVKAAKKYGTYPSVMIAQAIVESGWGQSALAVNVNNLFGMKASGWSGPTYSTKTR
ncbi:UNVERIFIED_CONTAM: N-acetylmuramidase, partial [Lactiplantibacillus plantarum]